MSDSITFRDGKPAIDVKDRRTYHQESAKVKALIDALPESVVLTVYEGAQESFWRFSAPELARAHGYGDTYSEGRSSGWLLVDNPPVLDLEKQDLDGTDLDTEEERLQVNRAGWEDFEREIEQEIEECRGLFYTGLEEALSEHESADRKVKAVAAMLDSDVTRAVIELAERGRVPRAELDQIVLDHGDFPTTTDEEGR
jgi:hypothetical protein